MNEIIELSICCDCLDVDANGEQNMRDAIGNYYTEDEVEAWLSNYYEGRSNYSYGFGYQDPLEPHFSWHHCDCCGSTLGGDRFDVTAVAK